MAAAVLMAVVGGKAAPPLAPKVDRTAAGAMALAAELVDLMGGSPEREAGRLERAQERMADSTGMETVEAAATVELMAAEDTRW